MDFETSSSLPPHSTKTDMLTHRASISLSVTCCHAILRINEALTVMMLYSTEFLLREIVVQKSHQMNVFVLHGMQRPRSCASSFSGDARWLKIINYSIKRGKFASNESSWLTWTNFHDSKKQSQTHCRVVKRMIRQILLSFHFCSRLFLLLPLVKIDAPPLSRSFISADDCLASIYFTNCELLIQDPLPLYR